MVLLRPNAPRQRLTAEVLSESKSKTSRDKSFADDLDKERGIVKSRVALLLRSSEIKPFVLKICLQALISSNVAILKLFSLL